MTAQLREPSMEDLFGGACNHVPVRLRKLSNANLIWLNRRVALADPRFAAFHGDVDAVGRHILDGCAYEVVPTAHRSHVTPSPEDHIGFADRYGGGGIGHNGGSGRGVSFNGYHIKGVGRTPLVSHLTKESHASGGAYLEECVRETIFSEIVAAEFPHGAIPTLAIIDTGLTQTWNTALGPKVERRTLLVRPQFLRPAHFERALGFVSGSPGEGVQDHTRVSRVFELAIEVYGQSGLICLYESLWIKWARQLAFSFVHRLPHGSNTTSNICFDGRLVDFGAMSAVPSWSNAATSYFPQPFRDQFTCITRAIESLSYYFGRFVDSRLGLPEVKNELIAHATREYRRTVCVETLRLCGLSTDAAKAALDHLEPEAIWSVVATLIAHYQVERIDLIDSLPNLRLPWDIPQVWTVSVPRHLQPLRRILEGIVGPNARESAALDCCACAVSRAMLYAPSAKESIYQALDRNSHHDHADDVAQVAALIQTCVAHSLRLPRQI